ncbi:hypothetical protein AAG906_017216 [Vitis piasezkii]
MSLWSSMSQSSGECGCIAEGVVGPKYYNQKTKMIVGKKGMGGGSKARPMFVQFVLEPLWQVYQAALEPDGDKSMLQKHKDPKVVLLAVLSRWLPCQMQSCQWWLSREVSDDGPSSNVLAEAELVRKSVEACDFSPEAPLPIKMLPQRGPNGDILNNSTDEGGSGESDECFIAFARVFSGVLFAGQRVFVLSALYDPLKPEAMQKHVQEAELHSLYLMMGQGLKPVALAKAGNIVAIRGLGQHILKSATLSSTKNCWPFSSLVFQPSDPTDMGALMKGLRLLNRADPFVEVSVSARGEHVLAAAGEVHLERCIKDLKDRFARVSLEVSPPLVPYKETIQGEVSDLLENLKSLSGSLDYIERKTPNGRCCVRVQVLKLPPSLTKVLDKSADLLRDIIGGKLGQSNKSSETQRSSRLEDENSIEALRKRIMDAVEGDILGGTEESDKDRAEKCKAMWLQFLKRIWALGPRQIGPNILFTPDSRGEDAEFPVLVRGSSHVSERLGFVDESSNGGMDAEPSSVVTPALCMEAESLESSVISGFQLATAAGPLCKEPMWGQQSDDLETSYQPLEQYGIFTGQVMNTVKDACRTAVLQKKPRLVEAMYFCELNTPTEYLGPMYAVLARRRARVLKEEMQEGSSLFTVHAYVPVSESFGFPDELRRWTSGASSALLVLSHWEALPEDPFFVPKTEEEIEEFGDGSSVLHNTARKLIDAVRRQKGLPVEEKVVQHATKQRTLARKV